MGSLGEGGDPERPVRDQALTTVDAGGPANGQTAQHVPLQRDRHSLPVCQIILKDLRQQNDSTQFAKLSDLYVIIRFLACRSVRTSRRFGAWNGTRSRGREARDGPCPLNRPWPEVSHLEVEQVT